ncbi:MAG: hypothetical protein ACOZNI_18685 [Myxococcota bacterium]
MIFLLACTGGGDDTGKDGPEDFDGTFVLTDERNYGFTSALDIGCEEAPLGEDFTIDWSRLTTDMLGQPVDPAADVSTATLIAFDISQEEVEAALVIEDLDGNDLVAFASNDTVTGTTSCLLSDLIVPPAVEVRPEEHFTKPEWTWLLTVGAGLTENFMVTFLCPVEGSTVDTVYIEDDSTALTFEAELEELDAFDIAEPSAYAVEWGGLTTHANGEAIDLVELDQLMIARYDLALPAIEADFINLESLAAELYTMDVYGLTEADLGDALDADGAAFAGFGAGTTWLLALRCTECTNPAPPFLTVIEVE